MQQESLKKKTVKGVMWSAMERFSTQGVQFVVMIVMARLLTPHDYGIVGLLTIFLAIAQALIDSGFSQALIRKQDRTDVDNNTVFYFNLVVSGGLYVVLFLIAPFVADFYKLPLLCSVMRVVCLGVIFNSLAVVQRALYTARLDFKTQAKASFFSAVVSGVIGISLAYYGSGVWALVIQQLINLALNTILLWIMSSWRPQLCYSWEAFRELFSFGSKMLASGLLDTIYVNIYPIVIGKLFSASSLGHYTRAQQFAQFPSSNLTGILQRVSYPVLCEIQNDDVRLAEAYRRLLKLSAYIIFPLMVGVSSVSQALVNITIGSRWQYCALLLQIICFSYMWYPIHAINLNLLQVKGRSDFFLKLEIAKKIVGVSVLCFTYRFGLEAMCFGNIASSLLCLVINTYYTGRLINVGYFKQMRDLLPTFVVCLFMYALIFVINQFVYSDVLQLLVGILVGISFYFAVTYILKFKELQELLSMVKRK